MAFEIVKLVGVNTVTIKGDTGEGVPEGGTTGQILRKQSNDNFDTEWIDADAGHKIQDSFSWGNVSSVLIRRMIANEIISSIQVIIMEPFNGIGATVMIGTDADHDLLSGANDIDLTNVGTYIVNPGYKFAADVDIKLFHNAGAGASIGSGLVIINF